MNRKIWAAMFALCLLGLLAGCSKKENTNEEQGTSPSSEVKPAPTAAPIDPATAASVSGTVTYGGAAPKAQKIDMSQDAACKGNNTAETIVADDGKLANVFVYVKEGLGDRTFDAPKDSTTIDQKGCQYHPHVLGVMSGQNIEIRMTTRPLITSILLRKTTGSGMSHSHRRQRRLKRTSPAKKSCCR